jgi:hypothetical protein
VQPEHFDGDEPDEHGKDAEVRREQRHHHDQGGDLVTFMFESPSEWSAIWFSGVEMSLFVGK